MDENETPVVEYKPTVKGQLAKSIVAMTVTIVVSALAENAMDRYLTRRVAKAQKTAE